MTQTLFDLTSEALALQAQIDHAAELLFSEDPDEVAKATTALEALITDEMFNRKAVDAKADAWCWVIEATRARAAAQKEHSARLAELARQAEHRAEVLQDRLIKALSYIEPTATSWTLPAHKLTSRRSTSVVVDCLPVDLPEQYRRTKVTVEADKTLLKLALQQGERVEGACLLERRSWQIR